MKNLLTSKKFSAFSKLPGFTMIELLVVIAVIGVLAVAVLSSINPIEQINKGRDTRTRSDAAQLINAADRYFAIHEEYPWNTTPTTVGTCFTAVTGTPAYAEPFDGTEQDCWDWADVLVTTAEVKEGFVNRLRSDDTVKVFKADGANETMYACFKPSSQAFKMEAAKNCSNQDGNISTIPDEVIFTNPNGDDADEPGCVDHSGVVPAIGENYICLP